MKKMGGNSVQKVHSITMMIRSKGKKLLFNMDNFSHESILCVAILPYFEVK